MYTSSSAADKAASPAARGARIGLPSTSHAMNAGGVINKAPATVARVRVAVGSPLTLTRTFHVPCSAAAARASAIASGINARASAARRDRGASARAREEPPEQSVDLWVDHESVVAAPNRDRGDVGTDAAAEVHDVICARVDGRGRHCRRLPQVVGEPSLRAQSETESDLIGSADNADGRLGDAGDVALVRGWIVEGDDVVDGVRPAMGEHLAVEASMAVADEGETRGVGRVDRDAAA